MARVFANTIPLISRCDSLDPENHVVMGFTCINNALLYKVMVKNPIEFSPLFIALLDSPQMLIAEEEKIIVEELQGNSTVMEEKSLVDTVYALKDQVKELKIETSVLAKNLEEERRARKKIEILLKKHVFAGREELLTDIFEE